MPRLIALTKGQFALVDDEWYDELSSVSWYAKWNPDTRSFYAMRIVNDPVTKRRSGEYMHRRITRFVWATVDHINHDTLDNRVENLRDGTGRNPQNRRLTLTPVTSTYHGVSASNSRGHKRWQAQIRVSGKNKHLGYFDNEVEAALAYDRASRELHGEYGTRNFD